MEDPPPGVYRRTGGKPIVKRMGRGRCRFALLACIVLAGAGLHAGNAAAAGEDPGSGAQTSSNGATATAQNVSNTSQTSTETQTGTDGGQSQTVTQSAPTEQTANAASVSQQNSTNASAGGSSGQDNHAGASSTAANTNNTTQQSAQTQQASAPQSADGQSQSTRQSAPTEQAANASANSTQVAPTNVNVVIRLDSPGNDGPVAQTNSSQANADAGNTNSLSQGSSQSQNGAGSAAGQSQSSSQSAPTTQSSQSTATSTQVNPLNANIVIRNKSPGDEGPVTQTNSVQSTAGAANSNAVDQAASQLQGGGGPGSGQSQGATQSAPTVQTAGATATSVQGSPTNASVTIDPAAPDPNGSGAIGTLIQVWIPNDPETSPARSPAAGEVVGANSSTATASAGNTNHVTQSAVQQQDAGGRPSSGPPTQVGGGTQTQVLEQSAPTTQTASAQATSIQGGAGPTSISSAAAQASNVSEVTQSATQIQHGGVGGSQVQVIRQEAPTTQWVNAESSRQVQGRATRPRARRTAARVQSRRVQCRPRPAEAARCRSSIRTPAATRAARAARPRSPCLAGPPALPGSRHHRAAVRPSPGRSARRVDDMTCATPVGARRKNRVSPARRSRPCSAHPETARRGSHSGPSQLCSFRSS